MLIGKYSSLCSLRVLACCVMLRLWCRSSVGFVLYLLEDTRHCVFLLCVFVFVSCCVVLRLLSCLSVVLVLFLLESVRPCVSWLCVFDVVSCCVVIRLLCFFFVLFFIVFCFIGSVIVFVRFCCVSMCLGLKSQNRDANVFHRKQDVRYVFCDVFCVCLCLFVWCCFVLFDVIVHIGKYSSLCFLY